MQSIKARVQSKPPAIDFEKFEGLLYTYRLHSNEKKIPLNLDPKSEMGLDQLEAKYGMGYFSERRSLLRTSLTIAASKGADVDAVHHALCKKLDQVMEHNLSRFKTIKHRKETLAPLYRTGHQLVKNLARWEKLYLQANLPMVRHFEPHYAHLRQVRDEVEGMLEQPEPLGHHRPTKPDLSGVRSALKAAGVPLGHTGFREALRRERCDAGPKNLPSAILMAVGLLDYRQNTRRR